MDYQAESIQKIWHMNGKCYQVNRTQVYDKSPNMYAVKIQIQEQYVVQTRASGNGIFTSVVLASEFLQDLNSIGILQTPVRADNKNTMVEISETAFRATIENSIKNIYKTIN